MKTRYAVMLVMLCAGLAHGETYSVRLDETWQETKDRHERIREAQRVEDRLYALERQQQEKERGELLQIIKRGKGREPHGE